ICLYIYPCTSRTLHFFFALLLCNISQLLYIAIPPCTYFLKLLRPLHCCTVVLYCIVLCCIFCVSTLRVTLPSQIPCLCKLTWPIKPDSDSDSDSDQQCQRLRSDPEGPR